MQKLESLLNRILKIFMAVCVASMSILIFSNVVSRYVFDSSITWANELSRFFFVWLIFLGAIKALKENEHMGVDLLIRRFPKSARKVSFLFTNLIVLVLLYLIFDGSIIITQLSVNSPAPATGIPFALINGMGIVVSIGMAIIVIVRLIRVIFFKDDVDQYIFPKHELEEIDGGEERINK
ncbi:TRAP transporter small permease [Bacillus sp. JJ1521]|uniref:TRAP transporter small permease n=1 Tax=Bacillus sp. JJ1521 TaxID=3122957 RepID=UPI002FFD67AD